ncbi:MAG: LysM peptidoglycan-binding domain-containing protein, partial [Anaerolineae bacterium]|nr:LysM peptidoglycan-binding domain-containing protein [Anaerolineae bacterium]
MMRRSFMLAGILLTGLLLAACNLNAPEITPTPEILISDTPTLSPSPTVSATPTRTPTQEQVEVPVVISTPVPTEPDLVPEANTPKPTPSTCEVSVQEGDTLTIMLFREPCGNQITQGLIDAVVALNDNLANADILPAIGSVLIVPRPTATPVPAGIEMTQTAGAESGVTIIGGQAFVGNPDFGCHTVEEGETIAGIAEQYRTTLEVLSQQNPNLNWLGCDFTNPSGGPNCGPGIRVDQCINVPLPTSTPVPTNTPSGNETATPTPTYAPVRAFFPPEGALASGRIQVQWVSAGVLQSGEVYLVEVVDRTAEISDNFVTRANAYTLPDRLIPTDRQPHIFDWRVSVASENTDGTYRIIG